MVWILNSQEPPDKKFPGNFVDHSNFYVCFNEDVDNDLNNFATTKNLYIFHIPFSDSHLELIEKINQSKTVVFYLFKMQK